MRLACYSFLLVILACLQSCGGQEQAGGQVKTLDSLSGAVSAIQKTFEGTDTLLLQRSLARFNYYRQFILQHMHDTISKSEADNLRHFYGGGNNLEVFATNRKLILERARLMNAQLARLSTDVKNKVNDAAVSGKFIAREKEEAGRLIETASEQQRQFYAGLEEFKNALNAVEILIKSRNNGSLPTIIKDTVNL